MKRTLVVMFGILLSSLGKAQAAPIAVPGTSVSLEPPMGFTLSNHFSGLENLDDGSSITITELPPEAYEEISTLFSEEESATEALLRQGIAVKEHTYLNIGNTQVPLLRGTQQSAGGTVTKYMTLFRGENTVLVTFNIIDPRQDTSEVIEAAVASISLTAAPTIAERIAQLPFTFHATAPFRVADVLGGSSALLTMIDGPDPSGLSPVVIIARGQSVVSEYNNIYRLSEQLLRSTQGFSLANIVQTNAVDFGGGRGYRLEATMDELTVVQYVFVPDNGRYVRLLATGEHQAFAKVLPAVENIANSVLTPD